jgi:hypothetical protein
MLLRISDERLVPDLDAHFVRSGMIVERLGGSLVQVTRQEDGAFPQEVASQVRIWQEIHPDAKVEILPP